MMFSATFNKGSREMAKMYLMDDHLKIKVGRVGSIHGNVVQDVSYRFAFTIYSLLMSA